MHAALDVVPPRRVLHEAKLDRLMDIDTRGVSKKVGKIPTNLLTWEIIPHIVRTVDSETVLRSK